MDVKEEKQLDNEKKSVSFHRSPKMSTYVTPSIDPPSVAPVYN